MHSTVQVHNTGAKYRLGLSCLCTHFRHQRLSFLLLLGQLFHIRYICLYVFILTCYYPNVYLHLLAFTFLFSLYSCLDPCSCLCLAQLHIYSAFLPSSGFLHLTIKNIVVSQFHTLLLVHTLPRFLLPSSLSLTLTHFRPRTWH